MEYKPTVEELLEEIELALEIIENVGDQTFFCEMNKGTKNMEVLCETPEMQRQGQIDFIKGNLEELRNTLGVRG